MSATFDWNAPELNKEQFNSFANLLCLRDGGQVVPASLHEDVLSDDGNDDWDVASVDTHKVHQISDSGHLGLKKKFLNCMAELAANSKGGKTVSCTAMKEDEDCVTIWIARNEGFPEKDKVVFDKLSLLLGKLSREYESPNAKAIKDVLWTEMVLYYQDRIKNDYVPNLRAEFKREDNVKDGKNTIKCRSVSFSELSMFRRLLFDAPASEHAKLVSCAYTLQIGSGDKKPLCDSSAVITERLWVQICLLARLRVGLQKFEEITLKLGSFNEVVIVLLPRADAIANPPGKTLSLKQTLRFLKLPVDSKTLKAMIGKSSLSGVDQEFTRLQRRKLQVHAEVQMLLFLCSNKLSFHGVLPYLGCSKFSCFLCSRLLHYHGKFASRGCHGRVFSQWTVPQTVGMVPEQCQRLNEALIRQQKALKKELKAPLREHRPQHKTSDAGGSSIAVGYHAEGLKRQSEVKTWRMKAEQDRIAEIFRRQTFEEKQSSSQTTYKETFTEQSDRMGECDTCYTPTSRSCGFCGKDLYCSKSCEDQSGWHHAFRCSRRSLTTADYLFRSLVEDKLSDADDVNEDFGFNHLPSFADKCKLFGLYRGLMLSDVVGPEEVHRWRIEGTLVTNIKEFYEKIPEQSRGGYHHWFLSHADILDKQMTREESIELAKATFFDEARMYLDPEDQEKDPRELRPEAKSRSFYMLAEVLHMAAPNPIEYNWHAFGFCTCDGKWQEGNLGGLYASLLLGDKLFEDVTRYAKLPIREGSTATFAEFWRAFEAGKLIQLMDSKGLKDRRMSFPFLEEFLSVPSSDPWPSVWDLKQFIAVDQPVKYPPIPAICADYGFMNCDTFEETCTLMQIYKRLLRKASPLELHKACLAGKLFEFAEKFDKMDKSYRKLMKNFYPLRGFE